MTIGIKYCGGCNPRYDRKKCLDAWQSQHPEHQFESPQWGKQYEVILLICGCERTCIRNYDTVKADRYIALYKPEDFDQLTL